MTPLKKTKVIVFMKKKLRKKIIIVGGGTAGSVIAKNLSSDFSVCIFEKSKYKNFPVLNNIPLLIGLLYKTSNKFIEKINLEFNPQRKVPFFVSNVLGGASVMNGCVHVMGSKNRWGKLLKRFDFSEQEFQDSYQNLFTKFSEKKKISIKSARKSDLDTVFFKALQLQGIPNGDVEWMDNCESGSVYNTASRIFRSSVKNLKPYKNAAINMHHMVEDLIVDDTSRVIGVIANGRHFFADYVILSGGVIGTNTLLQKKVFRLSDETFIELNLNAGVGVKDHTNLRVNVLSSKKINSLNEIGPKFLKKIELILKHFLGIKTLMMGTGASSAAHLDIDGDGIIDTRIQMLNFSETGRIGSNGELFSSSEPGFSISITVINPKSCGEIKLNPQGVTVQPQYLSKADDINHLQKTLSFVMSLLESDPFKDLIDRIDQSEVIKKNPCEYVLSNCYSGYHLIGGCSHLINKDFELNNIKNLYICDASVMSEHVSSNIHAAVVILADLFSKKFRNKQGI